VDGPTSQPPESGKPELGRQGTLGLPLATALIVGSIIGVGIFNLPGSLAQRTRMTEPPPVPAYRR
jgi:APA family basic amino acid/polyamine antiporter